MSLVDSELQRSQALFRTRNDIIIANAAEIEALEAFCIAINATLPAYSDKLIPCITTHECCVTGPFITIRAIASGSYGLIRLALHNSGESVVCELAHEYSKKDTVLTLANRSFPVILLGERCEKAAA